MKQLLAANEDGNTSAIRRRNIPERPGYAKYEKRHEGKTNSRSGVSADGIATAVTSLTTQD